MEAKILAVLVSACVWLNEKLGSCEVDDAHQLEQVVGYLVLLAAKHGVEISKSEEAITAAFHNAVDAHDICDVARDNQDEWSEDDLWFADDFRRFAAEIEAVAATPILGTGYIDCGCRDCFETTIGEPGDFCDECKEAGCEPDKECCAPGAYGGDDDNDDGEPESPDCPVCGGELIALGALGNTVHYKCRACGANSNTDAGDFAA